MSADLQDHCHSHQQELGFCPLYAGPPGGSHGNGTKSLSRDPSQLFKSSVGVANRQVEEKITRVWKTVDLPL